MFFIFLANIQSINVVCRWQISQFHTYVHTYSCIIAVQWYLPFSVICLHVNSILPKSMPSLTLLWNIWNKGPRPEGRILKVIFTLSYSAITSTSMIHMWTHVEAGSLSELTNAYVRASLLLPDSTKENILCYFSSFLSITFYKGIEDSTCFFF